MADNEPEVIPGMETTPDVAVLDDKPAKRGDTVTHTVTIETNALSTSVTDDEEAERAFRELYPTRKLDNVTMVSRVHNVGRNITYVYSAVLK